MHKHFGTKVDDFIDTIEKSSPEFAKVLVEFPFGELYSRDILDDKTRELITISALTVLGYALPELNLHVKAALNCGATKLEVMEVITQMIAYCGFPAAINALMTAKETFDKIDETSDSKL